MKHPNREAKRVWSVTLENVRQLSIEDVTRLLMQAEHELNHARYECCRKSPHDGVKKTHRDVHQRVVFVDDAITQILNGRLEP